MTNLVNTPHRIHSVAEFHQLLGVPKPLHPLVSIIQFESIQYLPASLPQCLTFDFYSIWLKKDFKGKMKYGQNEYDFNEGVMSFFAPNQLITNQIQGEISHSGWWLIVHPDLFWGFSLARTIKDYHYFSYAVSEALYVSEQEEHLVTGLLEGFYQELIQRIDDFSQPIMVAQIELLLRYADRFYHRQFITRRKANHHLLDQLEDVLTDYFTVGRSIELGLPTVQYIANALHVSPNYLSDVLKLHTGQSTQQHIQDKLIELAKVKLTTTRLTVSEIAYELGFEHPQSFTKLFKSKANCSPVHFRQSFN
ncbi:helix-turn-helix domain-containing protein [Spirosoma sp. HMF4905]|uniref:Helix-turn-helix domain-containing protein n=1 Tax=Spirosoma arboris TaxID=2682092 RepID=A0A7K1SLV7_9BACT|nr:AraC family transcriptional regulator [Spirosoma arboris]MVM34777.1 helix-turn-helix domain-containing protein [Spirosoma arboris]